MKVTLPTSSTWKFRWTSMSFHLLRQLTSISSPLLTFLRRFPSPFRRTWRPPTSSSPPLSMQ
eukprot:5261227-Pleurochrysis_carterae.AAC.1